MATPTGRSTDPVKDPAELEASTDDPSPYSISASAGQFVGVAGPEEDGEDEWAANPIVPNPGRTRATPRVTPTNKDRNKDLMAAAEDTRMAIMFTEELSSDDVNEDDSRAAAVGEANGAASTTTAETKDAKLTRTRTSPDMHGGSVSADDPTAAASSKSPGRRRRCTESCQDWWRSSAGGKSGVANVVIAIIIVAFGFGIATAPVWLEVMTKVSQVSEIYLQLTVPIQAFVGIICGVLIVFTFRAIRRVTCARRSTLKDIEDTAVARRHSKWRIIRVFECIMEAKGPGSVVWAEFTLAKEVLVETSLQIINVLDYANRGYSATALYIYMAVIALNTVVWWMLTLPRTIRTVRGILVMNALINTFYGFFAFAYFLVDDGMMLNLGVMRDLDVQTRRNLGIANCRNAIFGGTFEMAFDMMEENIIWKVLTRIVPLFLAVSAIEDLAGLDAFLKQKQDASTPEDPTEGGHHPAQKSDDADPPPSSSSRSPSPPTTKTRKRQPSTFTRLRRHLTNSKHHPGLKKKVVLPVVVAVLAVIVSMAVRLAVLSNGCQFEPGETYSTSGGQPQRQQHWIGRWCLRQAFPLLSALPGSPSECACAVLFVKPATNQTGCDPTALTRLHDDLVDEDLNIAQYLRAMIHHCPMQNKTQTEQILAAKLEYVTSIEVRDGRKATVGGRSTSLGETLELPDLRTKNLLMLDIGGLPLSIRARETTLKTCTKLLNLILNNNHLTLHPSLEMNTVLVMLDLSNNRLVQIPSLEKHTALTYLYVGNNPLTSSVWSSLGPALTSLRVLSAAHSRLDHIPSWVQRLPQLVYLDLSGNNITSIGAPDGASPANANQVVPGDLGRNASQLLVGGNPVCEMTTVVAGSGGGVAATAVWSSRWKVQCRSQCSNCTLFRCMDIVIPLEEHYMVYEYCLIIGGMCNIGCNTTACGYDGGDCLL